ncbi:putative zinc finger protein dhhc domain containing protein [Erysiphe necator]|uniref:Putative zinc finger protein dhhc domain containing protein n=1 Tax=Uncinula necator TaxID=52586 RepID=A0A0B1PAA2_UNCNE|nr:putative zinc finger protein dhhc domain containing protein [Erysiphe necator]
MDGYSRSQAPSRMPPLFNPTNNLPPINLSGNSSIEAHPPAIHYARRDTGAHQIDAQNAPPTVNTSYQVRTDLPRHTNLHESGRMRRSTMDNYGFAGSSNSLLPEQEMPNFPPISQNIYEKTYRPAEGGYTPAPAPLRYENQSQQHHHWERDNNQNQFIDTEISSQPIQVSNSGRYLEPVSYDHDEEEFRYTNPREISLYDLEHIYEDPRSTRSRYDSDRKPRPRSIQTYADLVTPNVYDSRDDGPPVSSRGFDRLRLGIREKYPPASSVRASSIEPRSELRHRPHSVDAKKSGRSSHHSGRARSRSRDELYGSRERRRRRQNSLEKEEYMERLRMRTERRDQSENGGIGKRRNRTESKNPKELRGRDALAAGLSIAGAALGLAALRNVNHDERKFHEEHEDSRRKELRKEKRHRKKRVDEESTDSQSSIDSKENSPDNKVSSVRSSNTSQEDAMSSNFNTYGQEERQKMREKRVDYFERRQKFKNRSKIDLMETSSSDNETSRSRHRSSRRSKNSPVGTGYESNDTIDMSAIKQEMLKIYEQSSKNAGYEAETRRSKDSVIRNNGQKWISADNESYSTVASDGRPPRVVSPPRQKIDEKPVKGILRPPRDKFPEDPVPVREGVIPLEDFKRRGIPPDAVWTRVTRRLINPEALEASNERFEAHDDYILIFRVLTRDEIQHYADVTQEIRISHEQEFDEYEEYLASRSNAPEKNFEYHTHDHRGPDYYPNEASNYSRTDCFPEAQHGYGNVDYHIENYHGYGGAGYYPESQHSYARADYHPEGQHGYENIKYIPEDHHGNGQISYDGAHNYGSSDPSSLPYNNELPYDDRTRIRDTDWYSRGQIGTNMYAGGTRNDDNPSREYPFSRPLESQIPEFHPPGHVTEPYPPDIDPMAWNMMNSAGGWHEFRGP